MNRRKRYLYNHQEYGIKAKTIDLWLKKYKDNEIIWLEKYKRILSIKIQPKHRHRRSIRYNDMWLLPRDFNNYRFTRDAKTICRRKHNKWLYMPKRAIILGVK